MPSPEVVTLGCRLNAFESEVMREHARKAGLDDVVIVNTCAVTAEAVRQATQTIRRTRRERPDARIVVTGCAAQIEPARFTAMPEVDHVIGNAAKCSAATFTAIASGALARCAVDDIARVRETAGHLIDGFGGRVRAYVEVQNGCDHRCTFCVIPFGRGPSRSVPAGEVVAQVQQLVEGGCREVVLTGVDMTSYGADLPGQPSIGWLARQVLRHVPQLPRLRLSSIDQVEVDDHLLRAIAEEERLMPHLHLSLQSGDDLILKRMKRRHSRADAVTFCDSVRRLRPDIVLGADLIAGFPTETDAMFQNTLDAIEDCDITFVHAFPYSSRPQTPAARMPQLPRTLVKERAQQLRETGRRRLERFYASEIGRTRELLIEGSGLGRSPQFTPVRVVGPKRAAGSLVTVRITGAEPDALMGEVVDVKSGAAVVVSGNRPTDSTPARSLGA